LRYQENIPPEQLTSYASDNMLLFTAVLSLVIGIILIVLGRQGRQLWLLTWSIGLVVCSVLLAAAILLH